MPSTPAAECRFAAALSTNPESAQAVREVCRQAAENLAAPANLALVFVSHHHGPDFGPIAGQLCDQLGTEVLLGCTGEAIVAGGKEIEGQPALALWLAHLPATTVRLMHLEYEQTAEGGSIIGWPDDLLDPWPEGAALLALGEPFSFPADVMLDRLNEDRPGVPVIGGMASGGWAPKENRLLLGRSEYQAGAVAALVHGGVRVRPLVSQGCRPIGRPLVVTKAQRNVIVELGGRPPLAILQELIATLTPQEQELVRQGLHVGRVTNEYRSEFRRGDFLVRNVIGADPQSGAIAIGDFVRPGQTVQFHLRDAETADEDLRELLTSVGRGGAAAALLFTCNGRGTKLFDAPHHDAASVAELLGPIPTAGFFAQGELGPVGGKNYMHGFTASLALFERSE